jgi:hypothetical protein
MKVAIIAHHRTGSTALSNWLSLELGYKWIDEPLNSHNISYNQNTFTKDNILVKYIYQHFTNQTQIDEIINIFDKVIILTRNNLRECAISIVHANSSYNCHTKYKIDETWLNNNEKLIENKIYNLTHCNSEIKKITGGLHITYEGIFENKEDIPKLKEYLKLGDLKYTDAIDKKNRYQVTDGVLPEDTLIYVKKPYVHVLMSGNINKRKLI